MSAPQQQAVACLEQLPGAGRYSVEQHRWARLTRRAIDIVMEDYGVMVQVDGKQHDKDKSAWGEAAGAQWARDRELDRSVLSGGGRMVRLHHSDTATWPLCMLAAMQQVQQQTDSSFLYYSPSYPMSSRVAQTDI
jgi:very-short-patch-repair endonuclease